MAKPQAGLGALRERIVVQTLDATKDAIGASIQDWSTLATIWAEVRPASSGEAFRRSQMQSQSGWTIVARYRQDLTPQMRLVWRHRVFQIRGLENADMRRRFLSIAAEELNVTSLGTLGTFDSTVSTFDNTHLTMDAA